MAKYKTVHELINNLNTLGYKVTYYKRKDGGYLIKSINGKKYTGAKGNNKARELLNEKLSGKRKSQLTENVGIRQFKKLPKDIQRIYNLAEKEWNAKVKNGKYRKSTAINIIKNEGYNKFLEKTSKNIRYAEGFTSERNVDAYIETLQTMKRTINLKPEVIKAIDALINKLNKNRYGIKEENLKIAIEIAYDLSHDSGSITLDKIHQIERALGV